MGLKEVFSYYGVLDGRKPRRTLVEDIIEEREKMMVQQIKEMEDRLKRHMTECKREIIKEIQGIFSETKPQPKKEVKNAK